MLIPDMDRAAPRAFLAHLLDLDFATTLPKLALVFEYLVEDSPTIQDLDVLSILRVPHPIPNAGPALE